MGRDTPLTFTFDRPYLETLGEHAKHGRFIDTPATPFVDAVDDAITSDDGHRVLFGWRDTVPVEVEAGAAADFADTCFELRDDGVFDEETTDALVDPVRIQAARAFMDAHVDEFIDYAGWDELEELLRATGDDVTKRYLAEHAFAVALDGVERGTRMLYSIDDWLEDQTSDRIDWNGSGAQESPNWDDRIALLKLVARTTDGFEGNPYIERVITPSPEDAVNTVC